MSIVKLAKQLKAVKSFSPEMQEIYTALTQRKDMLEGRHDGQDITYYNRKNHAMVNKLLSLPPHHHHKKRYDLRQATHPALVQLAHKVIADGEYTLGTYYQPDAARKITLYWNPDTGFDVHVSAWEYGSLGVYTYIGCHDFQTFSINDMADWLSVELDIDLVQVHQHETTS